MAKDHTMDHRYMLSAGVCLGCTTMESDNRFLRLGRHSTPIALPLTVFMYRLCSAIFGIIGIFFVMLARNPLKYGGMLLLAAYGLVGYGIFSIVAGIRYGLPVWTYSGDVIFGVVAGVLLLIFRKKAMQTNSA